MNRRDFLVFALFLNVVTINAIVINTPRGQFTCPNGGAACTVIDISAAGRLLHMTGKEWNTLTPKKLEQLIQTGVNDYVKALQAIHQNPGYWFQAFQAAPYFAQLQQGDILNVVRIMPSPDDLAILQAAGEHIVTLDSLVTTMQNSKTPVCGVWTKSGSSQLICYKDKTWLFLDSHQQSTGSGGASLYLFKKTADFQNFLRTHHVFHLAESDDIYNQANVTLFRLKQVPTAPSSAQIKKQVAQLTKHVNAQKSAINKLVAGITKDKRMLKSLEVQRSRLAKQMKAKKVSPQTKKTFAQTIKKIRSTNSNIASQEKQLKAARSKQKQLEGELKKQQTALKKAKPTKKR